VILMNSGSCYVKYIAVAQGNRWHADMKTCVEEMPVLEMRPVTPRSADSVEGLALRPGRATRGSLEERSHGASSHQA